MLKKCGLWRWAYRHPNLILAISDAFVLSAVATLVIAYMSSLICLVLLLFKVVWH